MAGVAHLGLRCASSAAPTATPRQLISPHLGTPRHLDRRPAGAAPPPPSSVRRKNPRRSDPHRAQPKCVVPVSKTRAQRCGSIGSLTFGSQSVREQHGVRISTTPATAIEPDARRVRLAGLSPYDRPSSPPASISDGADEGLRPPATTWARVEGRAQRWRWRASKGACRNGGVFVMSISARGLSVACPAPTSAVPVGLVPQEHKPRAKRCSCRTPTRTDIQGPRSSRRNGRRTRHLELPRLSKVVKVDPAAREVNPEFGDKVRYEW